MASLKLEVEFVGAAMEADACHELASILKKVHDAFSDGSQRFLSMPLRDSNGNQVGVVWMEED